jgi:hypothetical protein
MSPYCSIRIVWYDNIDEFRVELHIMIISITIIAFYIVRNIAKFMCNQEHERFIILARKCHQLAMELRLVWYVDNR